MSRCPVWLRNHQGVELVSRDDHTFVICAYQESPYLEEAVRSVVNQSVLGKALISTATPNDHIQDIADRYGISVVHNTGLATASGNWNYGYDSAETQYVTIVHQDDYYDPAYLERVLEVLGSYPDEDVTIAFTDYYEMRDSKKVEDNSLLKIKRMMNTPLRSKRLNGSRLIRRRTLSLGDPICCPSVVLNKDIAGPSPFDTEMISSYDYKTWVDLADLEGRFVYIPDKLVGHRIHDESGTTQNIGSSQRSDDDRELIGSFWPTPIAWAICKLYAQAEKSNEL